ncbi:MAG TPA: DUF721 domain-containing protein [Bacillota bacterium]
MSTSSCRTIIENIFRRNGSLKRLLAGLSVYYWPRVAGEPLAKEVIAVRCSNGYLYLKTESPTLAHQLLLMNPEIIQRYRSLLGCQIIKGIKIKIGSIGKVEATPEIPAEPGLDEQEQKFIAANCEAIKDPELAQHFKGLMEKSFQARHRLQAEGAGFCLSCNVLIDPAYSYCPVCEIKLKDEILSYLKYLKKNGREIKRSELPLTLKDANEQLIREMLKLSLN